MSDLINRQDAIDALCAVCGKSCDKSEFVYNAPQDEQVILCPEHYCLCTLPSADRPTGEWIMSDYQRVEDTDNDNYLYTCSVCGHRDVHARTQEVPYCWWCGAKMEGVENENR